MKKDGSVPHELSIHMRWNHDASIAKNFRNRYFIILYHKTIGHSPRDSTLGYEHVSHCTRYLCDAKTSIFPVSTYPCRFNTELLVRGFINQTTVHMVAAHGHIHVSWNATWRNARAAQLTLRIPLQNVLSLFQPCYICFLLHICKNVSFDKAYTLRESSHLRCDLVDINIDQFSLSVPLPWKKNSHCLWFVDRTWRWYCHNPRDHTPRGHRIWACQLTEWTLWNLRVVWST